MYDAPQAERDAYKADLRATESRLQQLLGNGADEDLWPPGMTVTEAIKHIIDSRDRLAKELEAYKKAKAENDERFMIERDEARAEVERLKSLTTDQPDHGNEYAIVCHYKNQLAEAVKVIEFTETRCGEIRRVNKECDGMDEDWADQVIEGMQLQARDFLAKVKGEPVLQSPNEKAPS